jgi:anti-sigma regulatory factor (Ser/Thr protein kinase)
LAYCRHLGKMSSTASGKTVSIVIGNSIADMTRVADLVDRFGADHAIPQRAIIDLNVCLDELINNTISYGYEDQELHDIAVTLSLDGDELSAEIRDDATPFDPRQAAPAAPADRSEKIGGLGLHFVNALMDKVDYLRIGRQNVVKIAKRIL